MIVNGSKLLNLAPIKGMINYKVSFGGVSYGMSEAGYDIRLKQNVNFIRKGDGNYCVAVGVPSEAGVCEKVGFGRFALASAIEEFDMPDNLIGIVHDKSTWARKGLSVFNTVIESGWKGFLTIELVYHGNEDLIIPAGAGIAQVIFHEISEPKTYAGKYSGQPNRPVKAIESV